MPEQQRGQAVNLVDEESFVGASPSPPTKTTSF